MKNTMKEFNKAVKCFKKVQARYTRKYKGVKKAKLNV